jgi:hypothetical protein
MVITCDYCGSSITLGNAGWKSIQKHTMLPLKLVDQDGVTADIRSMMDKGFLHRHLQEQSQLEEMTLSYVPYWIIPVSARTNIVASDVAVQVGQIAATAAIIGLMSGMGGRRDSFAGPFVGGALVGSMMGQSGGAKKTYQMDNNYNFPVVALKALTEYQPRDYQFGLDNRTLFDVSKVPKNIKILNGDISEDAAQYQAKTLVDQVQSQKAHSQYHMIQLLHTDEDVSDGELLHAPVWFSRYGHKGKKIVLVVDANSGAAINSVGL